jgi:hypothetical protein
MFDVEKVTDLPIDVLRQTRMQLDYNDNPELLFMGFFRRYEFECGVKAIPEPIDVNKIHRFQDHSLVKLHKYDIRLSLLTGIKDLFKEEEMTELSLLINKDFKWKEFTIYGNSWNDVIFKYNRH